MGLYPGGGLFPGGFVFPGLDPIFEASPTYLAMIAELPPALQGSLDYRAIIRGYAKEIDLLEQAGETLRAQFNPAMADILLPAWEYQLRLPVGGNGASIDVRRANVIARLRKLLAGGEGREWVAAIDGLLGPGWTYMEHNPADPSSPADGIIQITVPFASGTDRFTDAQNQIRDITDAHLEIEFISTAPFTLDMSELDVAEFGD